MDTQLQQKAWNQNKHIQFTERRYVSVYITVNLFRNDLEEFLTVKKAKSNFGMDKAITYKDVLSGMFKLSKVVRIQNHNTDYSDSISGKGADFSNKSIKDSNKNRRNNVIIQNYFFPIFHSL